MAKAAQPKKQSSAPMAENKGITNPAANSGDIFDVRKIRRLVELMQEHDLGEIDLRDADVRIRLRKHRIRWWHATNRGL